MRYVCPKCKGEVVVADESYACGPCGLEYPVVCGIPDFRLFGDPYIDIEADRAKGQLLHNAIQDMTFAQAVRHYYEITPEDPPDLAEKWTARVLAEVEIAEKMLRIPRQYLLDIGCSTGAVLIANQGGIGVDIAFRWLVLGALRLKESGTSAALVCANAEHLPFPDGTFHRVTCFDSIEHFRDPLAALRETRRVGARLELTSNNRWAPLPEPHVHLWGVAWLPRSWQRQYVALRRRDLHPYGVRLLSAREGAWLARQAGWRNPQVEASPLHAPQKRFQFLLRFYNKVRRLPGLCLVAPRWLLRC
ncbi:MAG: methyltransferase domain-containing protein [Acidobacteria bacterium]|nr:methyltransferase domain-containing protein [Acidobacteriota bacterium]